MLKLSLKQTADKGFFGIESIEGVSHLMGSLVEETIYEKDPIKTKVVKYTIKYLKMMFTYDRYDIDMTMSVIDGGMDTDDRWLLNGMAMTPNKRYAILHQVIQADCDIKLEIEKLLTQINT